MSTLTFSTLRRVNLARCLEGFNHPLAAWSYPDWVVAVAGEFGESLNVLKKLNRERDGIPGNDRGKPELVSMLADEIADTAIYLDLLLASEEQEFFDEDEIVDFAGVREANGKVTHKLKDENPPDASSQWACHALRAIGKLAAAETRGDVRHSARLLLGMLDYIAHDRGIDLGAAVVTKFNATSMKLGFPHRMEATSP